MRLCPLRCHNLRPWASAWAQPIVSQIADRPCRTRAGFTGVIKLGNKANDHQAKSETPYRCVARFAQSMDGFKYVQQRYHFKAHRSWGGMRSLIC
eukprot:7258565-Pyramimonas_sp.AAC.1